MDVELAEAAVVVSLRGRTLAAEACPADDADALRAAAIGRADFLVLHRVHDLATALLAADDVDGTEFPEGSVADIRAWVARQVRDAAGETREARDEDDGRGDVEVAA